MTNLKCKICNRDCNGFVSLGTHIIRSHKISTKKYYDKFMKSLDEGFCKSCKGQTEFKTLSEGYRPTCSQSCSRKLMFSEEARKKSKQTCLERYGVENPSSLYWVKKKISNTQRERLLDPKEREKISIATKIAMKKPDVRQKFFAAVKKPKSKETIKKMSDAGKQKFINDPTLKDRLYTTERNEKISDFKTEYWKTHPEEKERVGNIWKLLKEKDETKWRKHLLRASQLGFNKIFHDGGETKLEKKMYKFLDLNNIKYQKQYELEYKLYDAYLLDYNILLEFDGEFWHKLSIEECAFPFQKNSFYNDITKNGIAKQHNIPLFRIRENDPPEKILEYINSIKIA